MWWWWEDEQISTVDRSFKLRSPSKIVLDIVVHYFDKKIKLCIILEVFQICSIKIYEAKNARFNRLFKKYVKMVVITISLSILYFNLCIM